MTTRSLIDRYVGPRGQRASLVRLSAATAAAEGHDVSELDEFPIYRLTLGACHVDFDTDEQNKAVNILNIYTQPDYRGQGYARAAIRYLLGRYRGWTVNPGVFTADGARIKHYFVVKP